MKIKLTRVSDIVNETANYAVELDGVYTVGEFIDKLLSEHSNEFTHGNVCIYREYTDWFFQRPNCKYKDGKLVSDPLPDDKLAMTISDIVASGGWGRMDFTIYSETTSALKYAPYAKQDILNYTKLQVKTADGELLAVIDNTLEAVANAICKYGLKNGDINISTNDFVVLNTFGTFVDKCFDSQYMEELRPVLVAKQRELEKHAFD